MNIKTFLLFYCALVILSSTYILIPITKEIAASLQVSELRVAMMTSVFSIGYALGVLVFGPLSDKIVKKKIITGGLLILAINTLLLSFVENIELILVFRTLQGFVAATFAPAALSYVFDAYPEDKRTTTIAFITAGFLMAGVVGQVISSWITMHYNWNGVYTFFSGAYLIAFALTWKYLEVTPVKNKDMLLFKVWRQMIILLKNTALVRCYLIAFSLFLTFVGLYASLGGFLASVYGLTDDEILGIRAVGIIGIALSLFAGKLTAKFGLLKVFAGGLFTAAFGLMLVWLSGSISAIAISSVILLAGISMVFPTIINVVGILGGESRGGAVALYIFSLFLGASAGPLIAAFVSFNILNLALIGIMLISFTLSLTIKLPANDVNVSQ